ncbi:MAG: cation transporter [Candidatus Micrarchaeia archaeon]
MEKTIKVKGMHCASCGKLVEMAAKEAGGRMLSADYNKSEIRVSVADEKGLEAVKKAIGAEGYAVY